MLFEHPLSGQLAVDEITRQLEADFAKSISRRSRLSHLLRQRQPRSDSRPVRIPDGSLPTWALDEPLPNPQEQIDSLVLWIGDRVRDPSSEERVTVSELSAWIGATVSRENPVAGLYWLLGQPEVKALTLWREESQTPRTVALRLTMPGWARYQSLTRQRVLSRTAFMAMKFDDPQLDTVVGNHFKPAVAEAGFELRLLTDGQGAGLIDDQLRVQIRRARFVIVDLTHGNRGAYWEAGFAEGLGRPVIYTCRKDAWEGRDGDKERLVHFDTNHLVTIIWDPADLEDTARRLTATIRATLPEEAKMSDG